jgi:hypothetical protein
MKTSLVSTMPDRSKLPHSETTTIVSPVIDETKGEIQMALLNHE